MHPEQWNFVGKKVGIVLTVDQMTVERLCFRSGQLKCFIAKKWTNWCGKKSGQWDNCVAGADS